MLHHCGYLDLPHWTFLSGEVRGIDTDRPHFKIEYSQEYAQKHDGLTILKLIKSIVAQQLRKFTSV